MAKLLILLFFIVKPMWVQGKPQMALKDEMLQQRHRMRKIRATLNGLEKTLGQKNQSFLQKMVEKEKLLNLIDELEMHQKGHKMLLQALYGSLEKTYLWLITENLRKDDSYRSLMRKDISIEVIKKRFSYLKDLVREGLEMERKLQVLKEDYQQYLNTEDQLQELIQNLELEKNQMAQHYDQAESTLEKLREDLLTRESINLNKGRLDQKKLILPVAHFSNFKNHLKGIKIKYHGAVEVVAPAAGTVIYAGHLSTLGNVIILDHGEDIRSVTVGPLEELAQKGLKVQKGQVIAKASPRDDEDGALYFEVRKTQKAVPVLNFIEL